MKKNKKQIKIIRRDIKTLHATMERIRWERGLEFLLYNDYYEPNSYITVEPLDYEGIRAIGNCNCAPAPLEYYDGNSGVDIGGSIPRENNSYSLGLGPYEK